MKKYLYLILIIIVLGILIFLGSQNLKNPDFCSVRLFELLELFFYGIVIVYFTYQLNKQASISSRKKELTYQKAMELQKFLDEDIGMIYPHSALSKDADEMKKILNRIRKLHNSISFLKNIASNEKKLIESIKILEVYANKIRELITGDNWNSSKSHNGNTKFHKYISDLSKIIDDIIIKLFEN